MTSPISPPECSTRGILPVPIWRQCQKMHLRSHYLVFLLLLLCFPGAFSDTQGNIYKGLWGGLFNKQRNHTSIFDAWQRTTESWKDQALNKQASLFAGFASSSVKEEGSDSLLNATLSLLSSDDDGSGSGALHEFASLLSKTDPKILAAAALVQGWVLSSVFKKFGHDEGASGAALLDRLKYPLPLPDPQWSAFDPALCLRLQNFGGAEGFREAYLFQGPCNLTDPAPRNGTDLSWGGTATFGLDCSLRESDEKSGLAPAPETEAGDDDINAGSWFAGLTLPTHRRICTVGIAATSGSGTVMGFSQDLPRLGAPEMNAMSIRLCNRALARGGAAAHADQDAAFLLQRLKLNGRPLLPPSGRAVPNNIGTCSHQIYYVKPRSVASGFSLDGALELPAGIWPEGTGIGESASLDIALGQYSFGSAALSYLRGGTS